MGEMAASDEEAEEVRASMRLLSSVRLRAMRQSLHEEKLKSGLVVPGRRAQLDKLVSLVNEVLSARKVCP